MKASNFTLPSTNKKNFTLKDKLGKYVVLYFYPKDDTPGCTIETNDFNKLLSKFKKLDCEVFGVSKDSIKKHEKFITKHSLTIDLISDDASICEKFGVWVEKSMYGKKYMGIERATFLFDKDLKLIKTWRSVKVKGHVEEVLDFIKNLN